MPFYLVITLAASKVGLRAHQVFRRNATQLQLSEFRTVDATLEFFFPAHRAVLQLLKVCSLLFVKVTDCTSWKMVWFLSTTTLKRSDQAIATSHAVAEQQMQKRRNHNYPCHVLLCYWSGGQGRTAWRFCMVLKKVQLLHMSQSTEIPKSSWDLNSRSLNHRFLSRQPMPMGQSFQSFIEMWPSEVDHLGCMDSQVDASWQEEKPSAHSASCLVT